MYIAKSCILCPRGLVQHCSWQPKVGQPSGRPDRQQMCSHTGSKSAMLKTQSSRGYMCMSACASACLHGCGHKRAWACCVCACVWVCRPGTGVFLSSYHCSLRQGLSQPAELDSQHAMGISSLTPECLPSIYVVPHWGSELWSSLLCSKHFLP